MHADFFLNPTAAYADIVLPAATSWEREGLRAGFDTSLASLKRVQLRQAVIAPRGEARSDTDIVLGLAERLGMNAQFFNGSADAGHNIVLAPAGLAVDQLRQHPEVVEVPGDVALKAHAKLTDGVPKGFATPTRRVEIYAEALFDHGIAPLPVLEAADLPAPAPGYPLRLGAAKVLAFCHSQHRNIESLRRLMPDPQAEIAPETARARGIIGGDWVRIRTNIGSAVARARVSRDLAEGTVCAQHVWWIEGAAGSPNDREHPLAANLNQVIDTSRDDPVSGSIPLRASWCEVEKMRV